MHARPDYPDPHQKPSGHPLVGKFFRSFDAAGDAHGQGEVVARVEDGLYLVQLFECGFGVKVEQVIVPIADMARWRFYDLAIEMRQVEAAKELTQ